MLFCGLAACSDATAPGVGDNAVGTYVLQSINNQPMPVPLGAFYGYSLEYTSSTLSVTADKSFHERSLITERLPDGRVAQIDTADAFGLWSEKGSTVYFFDATHADTLTAILKGGTLSYDVMQADSTYHHVYQKQ